MSIDAKWKDSLTDETATWDNATDDINSTEQLDDFIRANISEQYENFNEYFNAYVAENNLELPEIMRSSNIDKGYFYNIVNGDRRPKRDKLLCLCIGADMDITHINRALRICKYSKLDPKNERDLRIKFAVKSGIHDIIDINIMLDKADLEPLK